MLTSSLSQIALRLRITAKESEEWWDTLTKSQQKNYLQQHPRSKREVTSDEPEDKSSEEDDAAAPVAPARQQDKQPKLKTAVDYSPDVEKSTHGDGVTDAARVGLPGRMVPTPPGIPRLPNLNPTERKAEAKFASDFESNPDGLANDFLDMVKAGKRPPTFGTDDAKMLTAEWAGPAGEDRSQRRATLNTALHQTANAIAKRAFLKHLDSLPKRASIMVTVGGCGAGKGYSLGNVDIAKNAAAQSQAVWDSAGDQNATENPWLQEEAEKRGLTVTYVYVHADPRTSWADPNRGVIKRANNPEDGRMVDADVFADSYAIGAKNHKAFAEANKKNPNAKFIFIDSAGKPPTLVDGIPDEATKIDRKELAAFAKEALDKADAPPHIKDGGSVGKRIWNEKPSKGQSASFIMAATKKPATDKAKYSWEQYQAEELKRLKQLGEHPNAGKYGGGAMGKKPKPGQSDDGKVLNSRTVALIKKRLS